LTLLLYMMEQGFVAPTLNLEQIDPRCNMIRHARSVIEQTIGIGAVQNFAFGGVNTSLIVKQVDKDAT
jgi:3-oxoacyl-[acyl-carrier-protein] synthase II